MEPRVSLITLGVDDLARAASFYEAMGWQRDRRFTDGVAFFQLGGLILALWPRKDLAADAGVSLAGGTSGVVLAYNTRQAEEVASVLERAKQAGGEVVKPAQDAVWGGIQGYFRDTEGNLWEVAYNPAFPIDEEGRTTLPTTNHDSYADGYISRILTDVKTIAVVGASANEVRPSFFVMKYLIDKGYTVYPVNPGHAGKEILGQMTYASLADIPVAIDMVDVFRASDAVPGIVDEVLKLDPLPKVVWTQLTVRHDEAARRAEAAGIQVVMNRCPKIEYARLAGEIGWNGINSRVISAKKPVLRKGFQSFGIRQR